MEKRDRCEDSTKEARDSGTSPGAPTHHKEALLLQLAASCRAPLGSLLEAPSGVNAFLLSHWGALSPTTSYCNRGSWRKGTLNIWPGTTCPWASAKRRDRSRLPAALHTGSRALSAPSGLTPDRSLPARARSQPELPGWSARGPHLAQLLMDELLQLRGFLRRQRHAGAVASRLLNSPPHTVQPPSPLSRSRSIRGGRSTKRRGRVRLGRAGTRQPRRHH